MTDEAPAAAVDANPGTASGIALDELDPAIRPQDDLFRHVNGKWIARTEIPADKARYGSFSLLAEAAELAVREIIEEAQGADPGTEERKIGDLYASFMDEERIDALGWEPIRAELAEVATIDDIPSFLRGRRSRRNRSAALFMVVNKTGAVDSRFSFMVVLMVVVVVADSVCLRGPRART